MLEIKSGSATWKASALPVILSLQPVSFPPSLAPSLAPSSHFLFLWSCLIWGCIWLCSGDHVVPGLSPDLLHAKPALMLLHSLSLSLALFHISAPIPQPNNPKHRTFPQPSLAHSHNLMINLWSYHLCHLLHRVLQLPLLSIPTTTTLSLSSLHHLSPGLLQQPPHWSGSFHSLACTCLQPGAIFPTRHFCGYFPDPSTYTDY